MVINVIYLKLFNYSQMAMKQQRQAFCSTKSVKEMELKSIEDLPIFTSSLLIMKFWAFLLAHNWRRYASLIPYAVLNITQFMEIYFSTEPIDAIIRNAYIAVLFFNSTLRGVVLCLNRFGFEKVMESVRLLYIELQVSKV